jgi:hypothetical protein
MSDHIADKVCAMLETHAGADGSTRASTRVKDLVDLALILSSQPVQGPDLRVALTAGAAFRGLDPAGTIHRPRRARLATRLPPQGCRGRPHGSGLRSCGPPGHGVP